ncbi:MAG: PilZ domain-containing protein [Elusimicrobiota bacterium]
MLKSAKKGRIIPEKRRHPRFPVGITMSVHTGGRSVGKCRGTITDLSVSGMSFKSDKPLEKGCVLFLKINIPLEIRGEVLDIKSGTAGGPYRYGVRFHKIGYEGKQQGRPENFIAAKFQRN